MLDHLPTLNATLNGTAGILLLLGRYAIKKKQNPALHKRVMLSAFSVSVLFLVSYLYYHANHGSTKYQGEGALRTFYFAVLISHTILAALVPPAAIAALVLALRGKLEHHVRIVRWLWPAWVYVSFTGVVIYLMLYVL